MAKCRIALTTALAGVLLAGTVAVDAAQAQTIPFDHYLCYKATHTKVLPPPVVLIDQFDEAEKRQENVKPTRATKFCNPVFEKNGVRVLFDPVIHLMRYPIKSTAPTKHVEITNQFETVQLKTLLPVELLVPTTKSTAPPPPPPPTGEEYSFEHYKCYTLEKKTFTKKNVLVTDQFGTHNLSVTARARLCNPVTKIVAGRGFQIRNRERHLLCYTVKPLTTEPMRNVFTNNQFGPEQPLLGPAIELCLPTLKKLLPAAKKARSDAR